MVEDATKPSKTDGNLFHHFVVQLLYLSKKAHPGIEMGVLFLCNRVTEPNTDYCKILTRMMKYIQGIIGLPLILSIDKSGNIKWCVNAEFKVYKDMKIHTSSFMTMGTGGAYLHYS